MAQPFDMTMILVSHNAFRRDLRRLAAAADGGRRTEDPRRRDALLLGWETMKSLLQSHHVGEDQSIWPRMRAGLRTRPDDLAVLDAMEDEHHRIEPLMAAVDSALIGRENGDRDRLAEAVDRFATEVNAHLDHEERDAFPLVRVGLTPAQWNQSAREMRGGGLDALRAAPEYFPWLLDDAKPEDAAAVLTRVPPPLRLIYRKVWLPRYTRRPRW